MAVISYNAYRGVANVMTTGLDSLAATTGKAISAAFDNSSDLDPFADFELLVSNASAPTVNTVFELYIVPSIDGGTNYADGSASILPQSALYVGGFVVRAVTGAQRMVLPGIRIQPGFMKFVVQNTTNQTLSTGNTLRWNKYSMKVV